MPKRKRPQPKDDDDEETLVLPEDDEEETQKVDDDEPPKKKAKKSKPQLPRDGDKGDRNMATEIICTLQNTNDKLCSRNLVFRVNMTMQVVHETIQTAFGWKGTFKHQFTTADGTHIGDAHKANTVSQKKTTLNMILPATFTGTESVTLGSYEYFGEEQKKVNWKLELTTSTLKEVQGKKHLPMCVDGQGAAPTEGLTSIKAYEKKDKEFGQHEMDLINKKLLKGRTIAMWVRPGDDYNEISKRVMHNKHWWI